MRSEVLRRVEHVVDTYSGRACGSLADLDYLRGDAEELATFVELLVVILALGSAA